MLLDAHDRHSHNFPDPLSQILVASGDHVALVLHHSLHDAIVGISAFVHTRQPLEPTIFGYSQRDSVGLAQLFQLSHHTVGDVGNTLGVHAVHH